MPDGWSDEELSAAVTAYRQMQLLAKQGLPVNKVRIYEDLAEAHGRSAKAFEFRMQNISAVLVSMGQSWLTGLKPAKNVGTTVAKRLESLLAASASANSAIARPDYRVKLPAMRSWLIGVARNRSVITYGDLMRVFAIDRFSLRHALSHIGRHARDAGEPILTALVVNKARGRCSSGLEAEFGIRDDALERARLYTFWARDKSSSDKQDPAGHDLNAKAAKFAQVEIRPDQAAFRRAVFIACHGCCVITGCDIAETLDACHKKGRDWRLGHNTAADGFILRKDLHALYDRGLLEIGEDGVVRIRGNASKYYAALDGQTIRIAVQLQT